MWPIYYTRTMDVGNSPFLTYIFIRNIGLLVMPLIFAWLVLKYPTIRLKGEAVAKYTVKFRKDFFLVFLIVMSFGFWWTWYNYPVELHDRVEFDELQQAHIINLENYSLTSNPSDYIMPSQRNFPQTSYTMYPSSVHMIGFDLDHIYGFYSDDWVIHGINIATKYFITFTVAYFLMVQVKHNE